jgi:hypothetical protein
MKGKQNREKKDEEHTSFTVDTKDLINCLIIKINCLNENLINCLVIKVSYLDVDFINCLISKINCFDET